MRVLVAGGGVAGLEAVLALSALARDLVQIEVISPDKEFVYRPMLVAEPFGVAEVLRVDLEEVVADAGARHKLDALSAVNPADRVVETARGELLSYDALILAVGARPLEAVPGALSFSGAAERRRFAEMLKRLGRRGAKRLVFIVPKGVSWSIAAYELALLTAAERDARRLPDDVELVIVTHESGPLEVVGPSVSQLVASRLEEADITLKAGSVPAKDSSPVDSWRCQRWRWPRFPAFRSGLVGSSRPIRECTWRGLRPCGQPGTLRGFRSSKAASPLSSPMPPHVPSRPRPGRTYP